jgi:nucleotide-binding universal stress UspA family protein
MSLTPDSATMRFMVERPKRIVVGYDDSEPARRALDRAAALGGYGSTLTVVSVASDGDLSTAALANARRRLLDRLVTATYLQPVGEPADELVTAARDLEADVVVVGRRSGNPLRRLVLGSVSAYVLRHAPCDVLVVR